MIASVLDLPVGRGKKFLNHMNGFANAIVGGWGVDTIITFQSGFPIIIGGCPGALSNAGISQCALRPAYPNCFVAFNLGLSRPAAGALV